MKSLSKIVMIIIVLLSVSGWAQIKNIKEETVKIYGNCETCKTNIEKAGNVRNIAKVDWNKDTKMATIIYDSKKTSKDEILKRIALVGYDSQVFLAPDEVYAQLPECCRYNRELKSVGATLPVSVDKTQNEHAGHENVKQDVQSDNISKLQPVYDQYFAVKDALVGTNGDVAAIKAGALVSAVKAVDMNTLTMEEHNVWMRVMKLLTADAEKIATEKNVEKQREIFVQLSKHIYELAKVSKHSSPMYYQNCPMYKGGSNWLSKEDEVKNPFYGAKMLTCGSTVETIK